MHHRYLLAVSVIVGFFALALGRSPEPPNGAHASPARAEQIAVLADPVGPPTVPLPGGCGRVSPPTGDIAVCCVSGFVFVDGRPIAGAEVEVVNQRGDHVVRVTQVYSGTETRPYYQINLSAAPLNVAVGETITVTARYGSLQRSVSYPAFPGGQQGDVVLGRDSNDAYAFAGRIWGQAEALKLNKPFGIATDSLGYVYVSDRDNARIQVFRSNGQFERQWSTIGAQPGYFSTPNGITVDGEDNVYVGDSANDQVLKFSSQGTFITRWGTTGTSDGQFSTIRLLASDHAGHVYVLDNDRVQKFSSTGEHLLTWYVRGSGTNLFITLVDGMAVDVNGYLYLSGWDNYGDSRIQKYHPDGALAARWSSVGRFIQGTTIDKNGFIYFVDLSPDEIVKLNAEGREVARWPVELPAGSSFPTGIATDQQDNIYLLLQGSSVVQRYSSSTGVLNGGWGSVGMSDGHLVNPRAVAGGLATDFYVADTGASRIQQFTTSGNWIRSWGSLGAGSQQLNAPRGIAIGPAGEVYVADTGNHRVQQFTATGTLTDSWGGEGTGAGQFSRPSGVAIGADGAVYVADTGNNRVQRRGPNGTWEIWSSGVSPFAAPEGIAVGGDGSIYVADTGNRRVQQRLPNGSWQVWSLPPGVDAGIYKPIGIAVDRHTDVFISDSGTDQIYRFASNGIWIDAFGGRGSRNGLFFDVSGIGVAADGTIGVVDEIRNGVQLFNTLAYTLPIATIVHQDAFSYGPTDTIKLFGLGQDSDATNTITAYAWTSNRDGPIGTTATLELAASSLSPGTHQVSLRVRDDEGEWSQPMTTSLYVAGSADASWTMLLYLAGDFTDRGQQLGAFNRALARLGTTFDNPAVRIAVQIDGPAQGDTRRLLILPTSATTPPQVTEIPFQEQEMDNPKTLSEFILWGQTTFPAEHYALTIANHGQGLQGIAWDTTSNPDQMGYLTVAELGTALRADGLAPIDILHLDACSLGLLEVAYEVHDRAKVLIASQYLSWSYFAYDEYQATFSQEASPTTIASRIAKRYSARAQADGVPFTIAVLDLNRLEPLIVALDDLSRELIARVENDPNFRQSLATAWINSQRFESDGDFTIDELDMYIDLRDWLTKLSEQTSSPSVRQRAATVRAAIDGREPLVVPESSHFASRRLPPQYASGAFISLEGSGGISIFYPQEQRSQAFVSYINNTLFSFTRASQWPGFLLAGVGPLAPPGTKLTPVPGPLPPLENRPLHILYLPAVSR